MLLSAPGWTLMMNAVVQWSGAVLSSLRNTGSPGCMLGMSDASVGDVAAHEGSRQTTSSSSSGVVVDTCHLDNLLILMLKSVNGG